MPRIRINPYFPAEVRALADALGKYWRELATRVNETTWEDLRFPAQSINPSGAAGAATVDADTATLVFAGNTDQTCAGVAQMPHRWARGTPIRPHIHLRFPTSANANTRWKFEYDVASVNGVFTNNLGTFTALTPVTVANPQNIKTHAIAGLGEIDMTGYSESCIILWRITRLASSDDADNDANTCHLLEFDLHYQADKGGTPEDYPTL